MGHTHYIRFKTSHGNSSRVESDYQKAIVKCQQIVKFYNDRMKMIDLKHPDRLSGYSAHTKPGKYGGLNFNGTKELGHEDFVLREHYSENSSFEFCKTARKPYDTVVVACLIVLKHYLKGQVEVSSDGYSSDWYTGLELAKLATGLKSLKIPETIETKLTIVNQ